MLTSRRYTVVGCAVIVAAVASFFPASADAQNKKEDALLSDVDAILRTTDAKPPDGSLWQFQRVQSPVFIDEILRVAGLDGVHYAVTASGSVTLAKAVGGLMRIADALVPSDLPQAIAPVGSEQPKSFMFLASPCDRSRPDACPLFFAHLLIFDWNNQVLLTIHRRRDESDEVIRTLWLTAKPNTDPTLTTDEYLMATVKGVRRELFRIADAEMSRRRIRVAVGLAGEWKILEYQAAKGVATTVTSWRGGVPSGSLLE